MTRTLRGLALMVGLAFVIGGCAQPLKHTGAKPKPPQPVVAKKPGEPEKKATKPTASQPSAAESKQPETQKPVTPAPETANRKPPSPPPPPGRPVTKEIDASKVGMPLYPGAKVTYAQEWTWPESNLMGTRTTASLTSTDDPEKILKWYQGKLGAKAEVRRRDQPGSRKMAYVFLSDPKARVTKSATVMWVEETAGQPTGISIYLTVHHLPKPAA
jgi:type IV secretory pathway VirB10-like protein